MNLLLGQTAKFDNRGYLCQLRTEYSALSGCITVGRGCAILRVHSENGPIGRCRMRWVFRALGTRHASPKYNGRIGSYFLFDD